MVGGAGGENVSLCEGGSQEVAVCVLIQDPLTLNFDLEVTFRLRGISACKLKSSSS